MWIRGAARTGITLKCPHRRTRESAGTGGSRFIHQRRADRGRRRAAPGRGRPQRVAGIAAARYQLGRSFSIKAEARELVTRGVYSKIRNPIYVFGVVMVSGIVLVLHRPMLWLLLPVIIPLQTLRARREAAVLEAAFGDAYREYRRKTWF